MIAGAACLALVALLGVSPAGAGDGPGIRATGLSGGVPFTAYFLAVIPPGAGRDVGVRWDFGDGATSADSGTYHTFVEPGMYTVRLTVHSGDRVTETVAIQVLAHTGG